MRFQNWMWHAAASVAVLLSAFSATAENQDARPRAREIGIAPGVLRAGPLNAITDVAGVRVGNVTLVEGDDIRTGVTAILPHGGNLFQDKVPAGFAVGNAYGKFAGSTQIDELGEIEAPIVLTNTLSVADGIAGAEPQTLFRSWRCIFQTPACYFADCGSSPASFQRCADPALASILTKAAAGSAALAVTAAS
jgi:L-aminopeptidase/D-esterase-like protein